MLMVCDVCYCVDSNASYSTNTLTSTALIDEIIAQVSVTAITRDQFDSMQPPPVGCRM